MRSYSPGALATIALWKLAHMVYTDACITAWFTVMYDVMMISGVQPKMLPLQRWRNRMERMDDKDDYDDAVINAVIKR